MDEARKYRTSEAAKIAGTNANTANTYIKNKEIRLEEPGQRGNSANWTRSDVRHLASLVAIKRAGIDPKKVKGLVYALAGALDLLDDPRVLAKAEREGRVVIGEAWEPIEGDDDSEFLNAHTVTFDELAGALREPLSVRAVDFSVVVVIDALRLWRRIETRLSDLESAEVSK